MKTDLLLGAGKGVRLSVLEMIRKSAAGLGVPDIARRLGMSYMGIKAHCVALSAEGYLITWREPSSKGRPRLLYRLAKKGEELFEPSAPSLAMGLLSQAVAVHGTSFAEKLLLLHYRTETARYKAAVRGETSRERGLSYVQFRDSEGWMSGLEESGGEAIIEESRDPETEVLVSYPIVAKLREQMVSEVLGCPVIYSREGTVSRYRF